MQPRRTGRRWETSVSTADQDELLPLSASLQPLKTLGAPISYWSLWSLVTTGDVPAVRLGRYYGIRRQDLPVIAATLIRRTSRTPTPTKPAA
jgi:hypothetical protein